MRAHVLSNYYSENLSYQQTIREAGKLVSIEHISNCGLRKFIISIYIKLM